MSYVRKSKCTQLVASDLTKSYGTVDTIRDVSFTAEPGRVTAFLGPNGARKTTMLDIFAGLMTPTKGSALIGVFHTAN